MHKIKILIVNLFILFAFIILVFPLVTAHTLPEVYGAALFGVQNSDYSQFDNITLIINGIIHFNDYIFLMIISLIFLLYFFGIKKLHKKGMYSGRSELFFVMALVFITIYSIVLMIPLISAQTTTVTAPNSGENITAGTSFSITWTGSGNNHYKVGYSTNSSAACTGSSGTTGETAGWTLICHETSCSSPKSVTLELNSSTVRVKVSGHDGIHTAISVDCSDNVFTIATIPSIPQNLSSSVTDTSVNLTWSSQLSIELVTKYLIFRNGTNIANTTDNNTNYFLNTGLTPLTAYNYSVKAFNQIGESAFSSNFTASTTGNIPVVTLNSPSNSSSDNSNSVVFNCSATDDLGLVNITLYGNWSGGWHANETANITGLSNSTTFTKTLINNATYLWNCLAEDNDTNTDFGNSNFTFTLDNIIPSTVTNLSETSTGEFSIDWNWTNPSETDFNYTEIYRDGTFIANVSSPTNNYTMQGLSASTTYTISVRTVDNAGNINTTFVNDSATTQASSGGGNGGGSNDISKTISSLEDRDHEGFCYTTDSGATCPSSGTGTTTYCETYGWTVLWRHENHPESYSCTIGGSECIPNVTSSTMRVAVEAHDVPHNFIGFACSSSFSVGSDNYGQTLSVTWPAPSSGSSSSSSSSGGGGAETGVTNETSEEIIVVKEISKIIETIEPGEDKIIPIEIGNIKEISITAKNKISNAKIEVKQLENLPVDVKNLSNYVFSYFEINVLNISNDDIDNVSIVFIVNIFLVNENNIDKESIILNRFEEGNWTPLETSFISEENGEYIYKTLIGGFSLFAISGEEKSPSILGKIKKINKIILIPILIIIILSVILVLFLKFKKKNYYGNYSS